MAEKKDKKHALYLASPEDGTMHLVHADDVEERQAAGWKQPEGNQANGRPWNEERMLPGQDLAAGMAKATAEEDARAAKEEADEAEKARKDAEKAREDAPVKADMKVEVVTPKKK